jgi:NitT/TauT family transport system ATP-binding protein
MQNDIRIVDVSKSFRSGADEVRVLDHVTLDVAPGEFVCIVGPSGCGKTTLLKLIAGFDTDYDGQCLVGGKRHTAPSPDRGFVFQKPALFPWYSAIENITLGPRAAGKPRDWWSAESAKLIRFMGLDGFEQSYPYQLSGGMAQRVQLARVLINEPSALLMDEPFGALDYLTRLRMQQLVARLHTQYAMTTVFITHDVDEAVLMADRVVVLSTRPGRILADIRIDLPKPRDVDVVGSASYGEYKARILALLGFGGADAVTRH